MPQVSNAPEALNSLLESAYQSALKEYKGNKKKASQAAWSAAEKAGWHKGKDGKWMKMKKEMNEIVIDAFKEGTYPQGQFKSKELAEIASTYDPNVYEAPILIGHVSDYKGKTQIPAFGWIGKAKVVGEHLKLVVSQFSDQLKEFIQHGFYKKVSAAFFQPDDPNNPTPGKWHLHHLAFLGGAAPAVKGLEGIAFAEITGLGVEFAEMDTAVEGMDAIEEMGTEDTITDLTESCASFISEAEDILKIGIDGDTCRELLLEQLNELQTELFHCINLHCGFIEKLENLEEENTDEDDKEFAEEGEWITINGQHIQIGSEKANSMGISGKGKGSPERQERAKKLMSARQKRDRMYKHAEQINREGGAGAEALYKRADREYKRDTDKFYHKRNPLKFSEINEWIKSLLTKRKESVMDKEKEQQLQAKVTELEAKVTEFTEKERVANEAKAKAEAEAKEAEAKAKDETLKTEIKTFCETAIKENRMTPAMREKDEKTMFDLGKVSPEALKSFQEKYSTPIVSLGEQKELAEKEKEDNDKRPQVIKNAEKYVKTNPKEFSGMSAEDAIARAVFLQSRGKIKFEDK